MKNGILASYRDKFILLKEKHLTDEQFTLYEYAIHLADFDEAHTNFGTFEKSTYKKMCEDIGWKEDKFRKNFDALVDKGLLKLSDSKTVEVIGFSNYLPKYAFKRKNISAYLLELVAKTRSENSEMLSEDAKLLKPDYILATKPPAISDIGSYKVNTFIPRSDEEYEQIVKDEEFKLMTADDLKWIDKDIFERTGIQPKSNQANDDDRLEADIVDVFFNGSWEAYRNH